MLSRVFHSKKIQAFWGYKVKNLALCNENLDLILKPLDRPYIFQDLWGYIRPPLRGRILAQAKPAKAERINEKFTAGFCLKECSLTKKY